MRKTFTLAAAAMVVAAAVAVIVAAAAAMIVAASGAPQSSPQNVAGLRAAFENPPDGARIMMRWWWFGPDVSKTELEREMRFMKEGGIGGFEVQPVYPLDVKDAPRYLSSQFLDALKFTGEKARELGLRMDLTLASGWPYGGPHIPIAQASARLRLERTPVPANAASIPAPRLDEGESFVAAFLARGNRRVFSADGIERLADPVNGAVSVPPGAKAGGDKATPNRVVLFFIASRTRQMVKRAAAGAEGWVLDHYNRAALDNHLQAVGEKLLGALEKNTPYAVFSDSLEVYNADWTGDLLTEFRKRRGYDLTPYLPALAGDIGDNTRAIRHDWGRTLTELADERYLAPLREWARRHGTLFRSQTYGIPPVNLSSNALVDLPEGEGSHWRRFTPTRWASSASHLYKRPVTSSETWTWLHSPVFRATPLDMKAEADLHFLQGINQLIGHGWPYSPPEAGEPGWRFYAAAVFNQHNPWWIVMPDVAKYLQRISFLLRQGDPVNDVAVYLPTDDAWAGFALGRDSISQAMDGLLGPNLIPRILDAGYNFDFLDDGAIARAAWKHPIVILPGVERIPLATYRKLAEYARSGGTVIATRRLPSLAPELREAEAETPQIQELSRTVFRAALLKEEDALGDKLHAAMPPDVKAPPEIGVVHRKLPFAEVYFLANTSNHAVHGNGAFRVTGLQAAWWDPITGKASPAGSSGIDLNFAPYESRVLVFSKSATAPELRTAAPAPRSIDIAEGWKVTFPGESQPVSMSPLRSWTAEESRKFFSGRATYENTVNYPAADAARQRAYLTFGEGTPVTAAEPSSGNGMRAMLEGPVREAAVVYINGKIAGSVWCPPYEVDVRGLVHSGANTIRIVVANTAVNLLAKGPLPDYKDLTAKYGERFQPQDMNNLQPLPSGLLGPVRLVTR